MNDEDLERAGTRLKRQLKKSKHYSFYPSTLMNYASIKNRQHSRFKPRSLILIGIIFILIFLIFTLPNKSTSKKQTRIEDFEQIIDFNDSTQYTDYTFLNRILLEKNIDLQRLSTHSNANFDKNSFIHQLSKRLIVGHTFDELRRLTNSISLPLDTNKQVSVTAIIHATTMTQIYVQVQAILTQTTLPEHIWIICHTKEKAEIEARIMTLDRKRVTMIARDDIGHEYQWLQATSHIATEYAWIIDQDIAPGKRYLENALKLSQTEQYQSALLGTGGALLNPKSKDNVECIPDSQHLGNQQRSQAVDMIFDNWLLHRTWIPYLSRAIEIEENRKSFMTTTDEEDADDKKSTTPFMTGLFISRTLYIAAGIPSISLPTDPVERAYWGDVRLQRTEKSSTCRSLEIMIKNYNVMDEFSLLPSSIIDYYNNYYYQDMFYSQRHLTVEASNHDGDSSVLFYVNSIKEIEQLSPILCKFEARDDVDLHIVINSNIKENTYNGIKSTLSSLCNIDSRFPIHAIVHDLSLLQWSSTYDLHYRLSRVLALIQPKAMIYTVVDKEQQKPFIHSIKTACKIADVTDIYLPADDIPHAIWMTDFPLDTLSKWNSFTIKLMVTIDKNPIALARILSSIENAHYLGDQVDLTIFMDRNAGRIIQTFIENFHWKQGTKKIQHRIAEKLPEASIFVESWYPSSNDEYAIILNNKLELSKFYYIWAKYAILRYRYYNERTENEKLLCGISLYSPRILETDPSGPRLFNPGKVLMEAGYPGKDSESYLMQYATYMGAVYFPEHWREFHDYITARLADTYGFNMQQMMIPDLKSNEWIKTWRRYFEELMYLRSYLMLYPAFSQSLSTFHLELKRKELQEQFQDGISLYDVSLTKSMTDLSLPNFDDLSIFDIWGQLSNIEELKERGLKLHGEVSACLPATTEEIDLYHDPTDLLCPFAKIVTVPIEHENDPLPELPVQEVTIYL
ncbi:uncharacterized protein BX663DRAFT_492366 [Cokeromyces recurvatus]|uniref:uncharacterized protein n=1 Tax=Cokeromyces recurvatus TaxID=90255 RepID=UPI00221F9D5A|nr:uncharacterized protein BX663DRAFT_492366 [Cokeromyces recurvatus]KAI7907906.1 hypothetical protein BX663DRAFT_492366 [Cokeromyces recurvatus]